MMDGYTEALDERMPISDEPFEQLVRHTSWLAGITGGPNHTPHQLRELRRHAEELARRCADTIILCTEIQRQGYIVD